MVFNCQFFGFLFIDANPPITMTILYIPTCKYMPSRNMWHAKYTNSIYYHWRTAHPLLCVNIVCVYDMHKLALLLLH